MEQNLPPLPQGSTLQGIRAEGGTGAKGSGITFLWHDPYGGIPACPEAALGRGFINLNLLITALRQEARPVIEALGLKQDTGSRKIPVYAGENAMLVITGMGKVRAVIATTHLMHLAPGRARLRLINVGTCAAVTDQLALGEAVLAHKIWDHATEREFFPDVLLKHPLQEVSLGTFDRPVTGMKQPNLPCQTVDMEASGVFQAAQIFLAPHQMMFLKVVVDYVQSSAYDLSEMLKCYNRSMPDWLPLITEGYAWDGSAPVLTEGQERFLAEVAVHMRLTQTQTRQLEKAAQRFIVRGGENLDLLKPHLQTRPQHKSRRNLIFSTILAALNGS